MQKLLTIAQAGPPPMTHEQLRAWIRVTLCHALKPQTWAEILAALQRENLSLVEFFRLGRLERERRFQTPAALERALLQVPEQAERLKQIEEVLQRGEISLIPADDPRYPDAIKQFLERDAPPALYVRGRLGLLRQPALGVAGTRRPSPAGEASARLYAGKLARRGVTIVSGMARGCDLAAHAGALSAETGGTLILPGCGVLALRLPAEFQQALAAGRVLLLAPWPPDQPWLDRFALERNRLIVALSDGLFAVETGLRGGTSYAIHEARRTQKPLWTLRHPGAQWPAAAAGNPSLLRGGALPLDALEADGAPRAELLQDILERLQAQHRRRIAVPDWPPPQHPEQPELF